ncbi:MAG: 4Fe-4S binding protein [Pseudomonadota bacterium]
MRWEPAAQEALKQVPFMVRPLARKQIEARVAGQGRESVSLADYQAAEAAFRALSGGRSQAELAGLMPAANRPGVEMAPLEACRSELTGCPNRLIATDQWRQALQDWLARRDVSERLRGLVPGEQVLYHHKLKLAVAGCPNGCSRPQVADMALVGFVRPSFDLADCTACGACAQACPDQAITMTDEGPVWGEAACQGCRACAEACPAGCITTGQPAVRVLMGGKLGRHPHLADPVAEAADPAAAVELLDRALERYLAQARPGERFAAWWQRQGGRLDQ